MEHRLCRRVAADERGIALPADLDAAEEVGLGARHLEQAGRLEGAALAEDLLVRLEADQRPAPVHDGAELLQLALRLAALELHGVKLLAARDLDVQRLRQGVHDGDADPVQPARRVVNLALELAARMQRREDHLERRLRLVLRVRVDGDATAVVGDRQEAIGPELDLDPARVPGDRLVHAIVDHLGEKVVQRLLVGAADVHAGAPAHGLEAFEHLDVGGRVLVGGVASAAGSARLVGHEAFKR